MMRTDAIINLFNHACFSRISGRHDQSHVADKRKRLHAAQLCFGLTYFRLAGASKCIYVYIHL